ncbi:MAG: hypothetical protein CBD44_00105 [Flavobacteriaceae bacterium TMED184]|nr:MAG: hypothetical protein CBD44_00105 [Flavobacteriaceae bacterium TMED184]
MKWMFFYISLFVFTLLKGQDQIQVFSAVVENESTGFPMESVHVLNLTQIIGTTTDKNGRFEIKVSANDTLYFSYLGFKPLKLAVTNDLMKFGNAKFELTELALALEEIILRPYKLTGFLDIDAKNIPINTAKRYSVSGLPNIGYEAGNRNPYSITKTFKAILSPVDFLHNLFSQKEKQLRKLKKMREDDEIKNLLSSKFNREILTQLLYISKVEIYEILRGCNFSDTFIKDSNDLQILEAISECYDEYRVLKL